MSAEVKPLDPRLYDALFADDPEQFKALKEHPAIAWFFEGKIIDAAVLERIVDDPACEPRVAYLACHCARQRGIAIRKKKLFGAIIEYPIGGGHDVLAVIEGNPGAAAAVIEKMLAVAQRVIGIIGPWDQARRPPPAKGVARFSFLVSDGLYFGEGPEAAMSKDPMGAALLGQGALTMQAMIALTR